ncbi:MAG: hypothetical protein AAFR70_12105, partial [Pseudomonadota bacterium]
MSKLWACAGTRTLVAGLFIWCSVGLAATPATAQTGQTTSGETDQGNGRAAGRPGLSQQNGQQGPSRNGSGAAVAGLLRERLASVLIDETDRITGLVIGTKRLADASGGSRFQRIVMVPKAALRDVTELEQLSVSVGGGAMRQVSSLEHFDLADVLRGANASQKVAEIARSNRVSTALARERLRKAAISDPVSLLFLDEAEASPTGELGVAPGCARLPGLPRADRSVAFVSQTGAQSVSLRSFRRVTSDGVDGAVVTVRCDERELILGTVSKFRPGRRVSFSRLARMIHGLGYWLRHTHEDATLNLELVGERFTARCDGSVRRTSAQIALVDVNGDTGALNFGIIDVPPVRTEPVAKIAAGTVERELDWAVMHDWGKNGASPEFYVFTSANDGEFVLSRYCKHDLAVRGRVVGKTPSDVSEQSGFEFDDGSFALRLNDMTTLFTHPEVRHAVLIPSFPDRARGNRAPELFLSRFLRADQTEAHYLVGYSRNSASLFLTDLAAVMNGPAMESVIVNRLPSVKLDEAPRGSWDNLQFKLSEFGWPGLDRVARDTRVPSVRVVGRDIIVAGDAGLGLARISDSGSATVLMKVDFTASETPPPTTEGASETQINLGVHRLIGTTVIRVPGSSDYAAMALYADRRSTNDARDVLALMTVRDGSPGEIELLDLGRQIRNRAELAKQQLAPQRAALMSNLRPVDTLMSFAASRSLERFWGGLIVNVSAEFGELGTAGSDVDFAFGYTLNVWFNRFDRVWQQRAARPQDDQGLVPICEGFQFKNINVVAADNRPNRMIAT